MSLRNRVLGIIGACCATVILLWVFSPPLYVALTVGVLSGIVVPGLIARFLDSLEADE